MHRRAVLTLLAAFALSAPAHAQQSPGFDVRDTERRFEAQESAQDGRRSVAVPGVARNQAAGDPTPLFVLRNVLLTGAQTIAPARLAETWQPFIGKKVSQADLAAIASAIGDAYRAAGFHLSRAIVPPQDIAGGSVRIQVIEGAITDLELKGKGAEQFGIRELLHPVLIENPSRLVTLERQLMLISIRPGVRITDTQLEEIGNASGHFRLVVAVQTWHVYAFVGLDNLGSSAIGPWQSYATAAYNSMIAPGDTLALNLATTPGDPRQLRFARMSYDTPIGVDGLRIGASGLYSEVWPGDWRRLVADNTKTEAF